MLIGVPKEIKDQESRVGMLPSLVREAKLHGHEVMVEKNAGVGVGFDDEAYINAGAQMIDDAAEIFAKAEMIVKVKEPQPNECKQLSEEQLLFTYLHLAPDFTQTKLLLESGVTAIAYETVTDNKGGLPLLAPMSEVAGRMSTQVGAHYLQKTKGGRGILLGGVPGVEVGKVVIIGGGVVGTNAAKMAIGLGADVTIVDRSVNRLRELDDIFGARIKTICPTQDMMDRLIYDADLIIGAVLVPGAAAPKLVKRSHLSGMQNGSVIVDVAIDQGGCFETSKATTHSDPVFIIDNVVHYCVANMPGAVARTSNFALNNATLPFLLKLANKGWRKACLDDKHLLDGLNVTAGKLTYEMVAVAQDLEFTAAETIL